MNTKKDCCPAPYQELTEYRIGDLPAEAPLAIPFVPFQREDPPQYSHEVGLTRGTIFPGLDLPWMNTVNKSNPAAGTPLGEVMALEFAVDELQLYLNTHSKDQKAIEMFVYYVAKAKEARQYYVARFGPLSRDEAVQDGKFVWLNNPWPWEYQEREN